MDAEDVDDEIKAGWLIECGGRYYCADGSWCSNPDHAERFTRRPAALAKSSTMTTIEPREVTEHIWLLDRRD